MLNNLSKELTSAVTLEQVLETVIRNVSEIFNRATCHFDCRLMIAWWNRWLRMSLWSREMKWPWPNGPYKHAQPAGRGTDTLPAAAIRFIPLITARGTVGVMGIKPSDPVDFLTLDQRTLLDGYANLAALAIERASFAEKVAQSEVLRTTEKLQTALLNSISHELRTPLASITGVLTSLGESETAEPPSTRLDAATRLELLNSATQQAQRLNLLVQNLLDMTRLEAGAMRLNREPGDLLDLVNTVIQQTPERFINHPVNFDLPPDLPLVY